jgi:hypothetical protein
MNLGPRVSGVPGKTFEVQGWLAATSVPQTLGRSLPSWTLICQMGSYSSNPVGYGTTQEAARMGPLLGQPEAPGLRVW